MYVGVSSKAISDMNWAQWGREFLLEFDFHLGGDSVKDRSISLV